MDVDAADQVALTALATELVWRIDHGAAGAVHELFVDDGVLDLGGGAVVGREALAAWGAARQATDRTTRHVCTNHRFVASGAAAARGWVTLTVYLHDGPGVGAASPLVVGEYADDYVRTPAGWRFQRRTLEVLFQS